MRVGRRRTGAWLRFSTWTFVRRRHKPRRQNQLLDHGRRAREVQVSGVSTIDAGVAPSQGMTGPDLDLFGR